MRGLCDFAVLLTHQPGAVGEDDVSRLRDQGWSDAAIHDAIQVVSFFNYINRIAEAVGVEEEPDWT